jgi:serine/threonine protein kinase
VFAVPPVRGALPAPFWLRPLAHYALPRHPPSAANVLLDAAANAVLIDFGVARPLAAADAHAAATAPHHAPGHAARPAPRAGGAGGAGPAGAGSAAAHLRALAAGVACGGVAQMHGWCGTRDYLDPLFEQLGQLCDRSDVYGLVRPPGVCHAAGRWASSAASCRPR